MTKFPPVPQEIKPIAHLLKLADEHEDRNIVVTYWARMGACLFALRLVPGKKTPETGELIRALLDWLEQTKKANHDNDGLTNDTAGQALIEEYTLKMFDHADAQDKSEIFNKNTVKLFYTTGMLIDVLEQFAPLEEEWKEKRKYAKWKAAYIHNCLKQGERPLPGPPKRVNRKGEIVDADAASEEDIGEFRDLPDTNPGIDDTPQTPPDSSKSMETLFPSGPKLGDNGNFTHAPTSSPITPVYPSNPTPFNTPAPAQYPVNPTPPQQSPAVTPSLPAGKSTLSDSGNGSEPSPEQIQQAQKFCKFATSALNYDDVKNAMDYLEKAMTLLSCKDDK